MSTLELVERAPSSRGAATSVSIVLQFGATRVKGDFSPDTPVATVLESAPEYGGRNAVLTCRALADFRRQNDLPDGEQLACLYLTQEVSDGATLRSLGITSGSALLRAIKKSLSRSVSSDGPTPVSPTARTAPLAATAPATAVSTATAPTIISSAATASVSAVPATPASTTVAPAPPSSTAPTDAAPRPAAALPAQPAAAQATSAPGPDASDAVKPASVQPTSVPPAAALAGYTVPPAARSGLTPRVMSLAPAAPAVQWDWDVKDVAPPPPPRDEALVPGIDLTPGPRPPPLAKPFRFADYDARRAADAAASASKAAMEVDASQPCDRQEVLFRREATSAPATEELPDDFYKVTLEDLNLQMRELKAAAEREDPLMTEALREKQRKAKEDAHQYCVIRLALPSQLVLQARFGAREPISALYDFVRSHLRNSDTAVELYVTPPKRVLAPAQTFVAAGLCPCSNVRLGFKAPLSSVEQADQIQTVGESVAFSEAESLALTARPSATAVEKPPAPAHAHAPRDGKRSLESFLKLAKRPK